ncbi:MAG: bifunctional riboflavin kinase/FAD synthetase [Sediminibacterium sp.]
MKVHYELAPSLPAFRNAVITIGTFDGVHKGHQKIIQQLKETATAVSGETVIITFHPHPRKIVSSVPGDVKLLTTLQEKISLLEKAGIDHLVVVPFDHHFSNLSAEAYITDFIVAYFKPHTVVIGYDHRFGKGRIGDFQLLEQIGKQHGFLVNEISEQVLEESVVSSTKIRASIAIHDIEIANTFLGHPYFFDGLVVEGNKLGRTIGYPTANLHIASEEKLIPSDGVYAVRVTIDDANKVYDGRMNIGVRPTIDGKKRVVEVNIFDFDADIYGEQVKVELYYYLRGEVKFEGLEGLKAQLLQDKNKAAALLQGV